MIHSRKTIWLSLPIVVTSVIAGLVSWRHTQPERLHLRAVLRPHPDSNDGAVYVQGFSPDGSMLVAQNLRRSGTVIEVWDLATSKLRKVIEPGSSRSLDENGADRSARRQGFLGESVAPNFLGFSPNGTMMAVNDDTEGIKVWDTTTWQVRAAIKIFNPYECNFFSDGRRLLVRSDRELQIRDLSDGGQVAILETISELTIGVESWIAPDEKTVVVVSNKDSNELNSDWRVETWDTATWRKLQSIQWKDPARCNNGLSPDGRLVAGIDDEGFVRVWDIATGRKLRETKLPRAEDLDPEDLECKWSPVGANYLVWYAEGALLIYDFEKGQVRPVGEFDTAPCEDPFYSWSSDGRTLAFLTHKQFRKNLWISGLPANLQGPMSSLFGPPGWWPYCSVRRLDVRSGRVQAEPWDVQWLRSIAFSPDGSMLAVGDNRSKLHLFDVPKAAPAPQ